VDECSLELCEDPMTDSNRFANGASAPGERQVFVIKVEANSFGRQLLDNATEFSRLRAGVMLPVLATTS
jgi:hypothetical protein